MLDVIDIPACNLVGHSLGAIMACGFARSEPGRVKSLMIASPASGYGADGTDIQDERRTGRMSLMNELGPEGLARERHENLLSEDAPQSVRDRVRNIMAQLRPDGYAQAVELLVNGDIKADAAEISHCPLPWSWVGRTRLHLPTDAKPLPTASGPQHSKFCPGSVTRATWRDRTCSIRSSVSIWKGMHEQAQGKGAQLYRPGP